jgi:hypothetical protein
MNTLSQSSYIIESQILFNMKQDISQNSTALYMAKQYYRINTSKYRFRKLASSICILQNMVLETCTILGTKNIYIDIFLNQQVLNIRKYAHSNNRVRVSKLA